MALAEQAMAECDDIIIAVTSAQYNYLEKDPFTAGERIEMIRNAMRESGADPSRYMILGLENQHNVATWPAYLKAALPPFQRVYSGNPYVAMLLQDHGTEVVRPKMLDREVFNATTLRRMMASGGGWRSRVPPAVAQSIKDGEVDALAFASPSSVVSFAIALGGLSKAPASVRMAVIGETTADACWRAGRAPDAVARESSATALAEAVAEAVQAAGAA